MSGLVFHHVRYRVEFILSLLSDFDIQLNSVSKQKEALHKLIVHFEHGNDHGTVFLYLG